MITCERAKGYAQMLLKLVPNVVVLAAMRRASSQLGGLRAAVLP